MAWSTEPGLKGHGDGNNISMLCVLSQRTQTFWEQT